MVYYRLQRSAVGEVLRMSLQLSQAQDYQFLPPPPSTHAPPAFDSGRDLEPVLSLSDDVSDARRIFDVARFYEETGDLKSAAAAYRELIQKAPTAEGYLILGGVYYKLGEYQRSLSVLRRSLAIIHRARRRSLPLRTATEVGAHYGSALANLLLGKLEAAKLEARAALAIDPQNAGPRFALAYAHELDGEWEAAADDYEQAILLEPGLKDAYTRLADLLVGIADRTPDASRRYSLVEAAISLFRELIERFPADSSQAHNNLGVLLARKEEHQAALREFKAAFEADTQNFAAVTNLGLAYVATNRPEEAVRIYENLASEISGRQGKSRSAQEASFVFNSLGMALAKAQEADPQRHPDFLDRAEVAFLKAIDLDPRNSDARNNLGTIYAAMGRLDDALDQFNKVLEFDPQNQYARNASSEVAIKKYSPGSPDDPKEQARIDRTLRFLERLRQEGDEEEQRETFARLKQVLDEERSSYRRLFSD